MNPRKPNVKNRLVRFGPRVVSAALPSILAMLIIAGFGSDHVFANPTDPSARNAGQNDDHEKMEIQFTDNDDAVARPSRPRVAARPFAAPAITANGVRMYQVQPTESGGWPIRPSHDDTYGYGELIAVEVEFSEDVNVNGNATFRMQIGSSRRELVPVSHRGDTVIFGALIRSSDVDTNGVWIGDNSSTLDHNPASYFRDADGNQNVNLTHASLGTQSDHKVDGSSTRPKVNRVRITSSPQFADYYVRGEKVTVEVRFDRSVVVSGTPAARLRVEAFGSTATRTANYLRGSGTSTLIFEYRTSQFDNDSNGIAIPANTLAKEGDVSKGPEGGGSIKGSSRTLRARLASGGRGNDANHKSDGRYAAIPEVMANALWKWPTNTGTSDSITMDFTVRQDPGHFSEDHALVAAFGWSSIGNTRFGFGIRTDVDNPDTDGSEGNGIVFNRWGTHDKTQARPTGDGWVVTGSILGDFISIRKPYEWGAGDYTVRIAHDGTDDDTDGRWYGMWITDPNNVETYMGSLKFPLVGGEPPKIKPRGDVYSSMLVILGASVIKPHEIPVFEIALSPPDEGSSTDPPKRIVATYSQLHGVISNANITHDRDDNRVILRAGGTTLRTTDPGTAITIRNDQATGEPAIRGTAQRDETLSVSTSNIADADGLDGATFTYQWIRVDGTSETDIRGATGDLYTLRAADAGKTIKVRVSFTDDAGYAESVTSDPTEMVPLPPLTAGFVDVPSSHNGRNSFMFELRFSENVSGLSYLTLRDHAFTVEGGEVVKARRMFRPKNRRWEITVQPSGTGAVTITLPQATDCSMASQICTQDGRMLSNATTATVNGP